MSTQSIETTESLPKRLTETDVKLMFSCLTNNQQPPTKLRFKIIRVPHNGLKLSPPSFEFNDGLYVLLRSPIAGLASIPSHHVDKLMTDSDLASLPSCPWSLSGPQYKKEQGQTVQQRYCYPRGNPSYSNGKGGSMWTMIDNGIEDNGCRILHVYHSNKRSGLVAADTANKNEGKRKHSSVSVTKMEKKARSVTAESVIRRGLIQEELLKSLYLQPQLSEMDSNLNFTSSNLFDINVVPVDNKFSFMPIRGMQSHDELMLNDDAFERAVVAGNGLPSFDSFDQCPLSVRRCTFACDDGCYAVHQVQSHESAIYHPPVARALFDCKVPSMYQPSYPPPPAKVGTTTKSNDLYMRLKSMEEELLCEIRETKNTSEQLQKLELIQNWAKSIAMRPLQPRGEPTQYAQSASSEAAAISAMVTFPMIVPRVDTTHDEHAASSKLVMVAAMTTMESHPGSPNGQLITEKESSGTPGTPSITP